MMQINPNNIRRVLFFEYEFHKAKNLKEVEERLKKTFESLPTKDLIKVFGEVKERLKLKYELPEYSEALALRSKAISPTMIYFLFLREDEKSGKIVLFETIHSWYTHDKIISSMRAFCRNAGIKYRPLDNHENS